MFNKVLIVDDLGSINQGVASVLQTLKVSNVVQAQYCDEAYLKLKKAKMDGEPFELLITDLSFKADHREQEFTSGESLVKAIHQDFPNLKIIVYSIEDRLQTVRQLLEYGVSAYVCKGRRGLLELQQALDEVFNGGQFLSKEISHALNQKSEMEIEDFDIELMRQLSLGYSQDQISKSFKEAKVYPNSLSSIEKRLNRLRIQFNANNAIHLVAIVKDLGLI
ncbi:response regulator [Mangrovimonas sp. DI 80]|uniref:response regulator n=1 Tax=Mangrovimonas sp. DI 80 TaxID=1779330 RepID=UPI000977B97F|nr:response regulator [Mangrovimonas sp. DI 80]OMP30338.1 response regulator [Mangrovimonas sp. DI 80]